MDGFEYRVVAAPSRVKKSLSLKKSSSRLAQNVEDILNEAAREGWEYLRSDTLLRDMGGRFFKRPPVKQTFMVFRRPATYQAHQPVEQDQQYFAPPLPSAVNANAGSLDDAYYPEIDR